MTTNEPELSPCPFCGSEPTIEGEKRIIVICQDDLCDSNPSVSGHDREEAIRKWNHRA